MKKGRKLFCVVLAVSLLIATFGGAAFSTSAAYSHCIELANKAVAEYDGKEDDASASNGSKYISAYGASPGTSWCVIFAWWCADQVGVNENIVPKKASASIMSSNIAGNGGTVYNNSNNNLSSYQPHVGDFVWLQQHFMVITAVNGNNITVTHGNWGNTLSQNTYNWKTSTSFGGQTIMGYVAPWYVGDVDEDRSVTSTDARLIQQMYVGTVQAPTAGTHAFIRADVDADGEITSTDGRIALQMYAGNA